MTIQGIKMCGTKLLTLKDPLEFSGHTISSLPWDRTSLPASTANKLQILSSFQLLRLLTKVKFQWLMSTFQETTSCTVTYFKRAILKSSGKKVFKGRSPHQTSCQNKTLEPSFTSKMHERYGTLKAC